MTVESKRKILTRIAQVQTDIDTLKKVIVDLASNEFVSATLASAGGSRSYTRRGIGEVKETLTILKEELKQLRLLLRDKSGLQPDSQYIIWS